MAAALSAAPDVYLVSVDTLRADRLGCYGYPHNASPHVDRFAEGARVFEDCLCEVPLTGPSFAAMMTSLYPRMTGVTRNGLALPESIPTLAEQFRAAGYQTFCVQSNWTLKTKLSGQGRGFDVYDDDFHRRRWGLIKSERYADEVNERALDLLRTRDAAKPLFFWVHYSDPHAPYRFHRSFDPGKDAYRGKGKTGRMQRRYDSEVAYTDHHIGQLLDALPKENAVVLFVADHGESLGEHHYVGHGRRVYQTCVRVPLIVRGPGIAPGRTPAPARVLDVAPTLLALAGLAPPAGMLGRDLLQEKGAPGFRYVETYGGAVPGIPGAKTFMASRPPMRESVVKDGWKLIRHDNHAELYDLREDPMEEKDLAADMPEKVQELVPLLDEFQARTVPGKAAEAPLSGDDVEALKSLGYIH